MSPLKVTQTKSTIGSLGKHKKTIKALGLKRIRHSRVHGNTPQIQGMLHQVRHLVVVEEVDE